MVVTGAQTARDPAGLGELRGRIARLEEENAALREEQRRLEAERERLHAENERLRAEGKGLWEANERLRGEVEALRRAAKRQAAPFSKGDLTTNPRRSGRQPGAAYGIRAHRQPPGHVDRTVTVGLAACCPDCGGELTLERVAGHYQEDLPPTRPLVTCYEIQVGAAACAAAGSSPATRSRPATRSARRPRRLVLGRWRWRPGSARGWGCRQASSSGCLPSSACGSPPAESSRRSPAPAGHYSRPTRRWSRGVQASPVVAGDQTGWRVGGGKAWRWTFVGDQLTVYRIAQGRGYQDAAAVLGEGDAGGIQRDGWAPSRRFVHAAHQTCLAYLLRRCRELVSDAVAGQAKTPHAVRRLLQRALALGDACDTGSLDPATLAAQVAGLEAAVDRLVAGATRHPAPA